MNPYQLVIHGGAGTILKSAMTPTKEAAYLQALDAALQIGKHILAKGGSALDAVEKTVANLEDCPLFNAGRGSVFSSDGLNEMEASIMNGQNLQAGAVAAIKNVKNPITLARKVSDSPDFVYLMGEGAQAFAKQHQLEIAPDSYFYTDFRYEQWQAVKDQNKALLDHDSDRKFGTVGAVAIDLEGNLAAATSTGGLTNKKFGRIGDSSVIGSGTYANNATCAISCTGYGEYFIRSVVAYDVSCLMEYKGLSLEDACRMVVQGKLVQIGGEGGLIGVDHLGNIAMEFNSEGMYRGYANARETKSLIYK